MVSMDEEMRIWEQLVGNEEKDEVGNVNQSHQRKRGLGYGFAEVEEEDARKRVKLQHHHQEQENGNFSPGRRLTPPLQQQPSSVPMSQQYQQPPHVLPFQQVPMPMPMPGGLTGFVDMGERGGGQASVGVSVQQQQQQQTPYYYQQQQQQQTPPQQFGQQQQQQMQVPTSSAAANQMMYQVVYAYPPSQMGVHPSQQAPYGMGMPMFPQPFQFQGGFPQGGFPGAPFSMVPFSGFQPGTGAGAPGAAVAPGNPSTSSSQSSRSGKTNPSSSSSPASSGSCISSVREDPKTKPRRTKIVRHASMKPKNASSKYRGVSWHKRDKRWTARIWVKNSPHEIANSNKKPGATVCTGQFMDEIVAAISVDEKTLAHDPRDQVGHLLNFKDDNERLKLLADKLEANPRDRKMFRHNLGRNHPVFEVLSRRSVSTDSDSAK